LEPSVSSFDDFVRVSFPNEWLCVFGVVFLDEAVDCCLQVDQRIEHAVLQSATGQFGKEAFDGVEP
jgi:hypothetical protein